MCLDSTVVLRVGTGELFVEGGSSEVDGCFCSSMRCVNAQGSEPALVSGPQFHVLGWRVCHSPGEAWGCAAPL